MHATNLKPHPATRPTDFASGIRMHEYNKQGRPVTRMTAPSGIYFKKDDRSVFQHPVLHDQSKPGTYWIIRADRATSYHGTRVVLQGHVSFYRPTQGTTPFTRILTTQATLYPQKHIGTTKKHVTILRPGSHTEGKGMITNLKTGTTTILAQGVGHYNLQKTEGSKPENGPHRKHQAQGRPA